MENVIYLNSKELKNNFVYKLNKYTSDKMDNIPNLLVFSEGKIIKIMYFTEDTNVDSLISIFGEFYD